jgi:protein-disulfide isomerase
MKAGPAAALLALGMGLPAPDLVEGRRGSPVRVVIYEDLQCPDCADFRVMLDEKLLPKYGDRVSFVHRDFPLAKHAWARKAAIAARFFTARDERLGIAYRRHTMATLREIRPENFHERLEAFAREHGVKPEEALAALDDAALAARVEKDFQDGVARGVARTPTVLVNGKPFIETFTLEEISKGIDEALAETK